jgi:hypothetical protein
MRLNSNAMTSLFLTLIMLLSAGLAPVEWNEDSDEGTLEIEQADEMDLTDARGVSGVQKVLVIGAKFSDMADTNFSKNQLDQMFQVDFANFFSNISYGNISIDADVFAWINLPNPRSFYVDPGNPAAIPPIPPDPTVLIGLTVCQDLVTALEGWASTNSVTVNFASYTQLVCLVNGDSYRGWAYGPTFGNTFPLDLAGGSKLKIPATVVSETGGLTAAGFWEVPPDPVEFWGRVAHEFGHLLGKRHAESNYINDYALMAGLYPGHMIAFKSNDADDCGTQLDWLPDANIVNATPGTVQDILLRPLELDIPGNNQSIRINTTSTGKVFYMVELRKHINSDGYVDINGNDIMFDEGVVIYKIDRTQCNDAVTIQDQASIDADGDGNDDGHEAWQVGDPPFNPIVLAGEYDISVEVIDTQFNNYIVRVTYGINGMSPADISITPWNTAEGEYYTPDIWIDSEINDWDWYGNDGEPSENANEKNGDIPLVGHVNRLWFNITNDGELPAFDVVVNAWATDPVAGKTSWDENEYIGQKVIPEIAPKSSFQDYIEWTPQVDGLEDDNVFDLHSCILVRVEELASGETTTGDNQAQENIHRFETTSSSPFHDVGMNFTVNNPYDYQTIVYAAVVGLPPGWTYNLAWEMEFISPSAKMVNSVSVTPPVSLNPFTSIGTPIDFQVVTWIENRSGGEFADIVVEHLGGNSISIAPVEKVDIDFDVGFDGGALNVDGTLNSQSFTSAGDVYSNSIVAIEYTSPDGIAYLHPVSMGYQTDTCHVRFAPGTSIDIVYTSPSGQTSTSSRYMNSNGVYMDSFQMSETGTWTAAYTYVDVEQNTHSWSTTVEVASRTPMPAPIADGYDKDCRAGTFTDTWGGSMEEESREDSGPIPYPFLTNGEWMVRVLYGGDSVHQSKASDYKIVLVQGMPNIHADVNVGDVFQVEGTLATSVHSASELTIIYVSPSGIQYRHTGAISRDSYSDRIILDEEGTWEIKLSYVDVNRESIEWTEIVSVIMKEVGPITHEPVIDQITHEDTISGGDVTVGGRLNATSASEGTTVTIRAWSPSGVFTTRDVTTDEDLRFENDIEMDEAGRWTIEYEYTDNDGNVMSWGEAIDVEDTEEKDIFTYESGVILAAALIILTGLLLVAVGKRNRQDD